MTRAARVARTIRTLLKTTYPQTAFRVSAFTSRTYAGVDVEWVPGPSREEVEALVNPYHAPGSGGFYVVCHPTTAKWRDFGARERRLVARFGKRQFIRAWLESVERIEAEIGRNDPTFDDKAMDATERALQEAAR